MFHFDLFHLIPSQGAAEALTQTDRPEWPYWVAIAALSSAVVTLFTLLMKSKADITAIQKSHSEEITKVHKDHISAAEEKAKRTAEEFARKDKAILDTSVEFAKLIEQTTGELRKMNDAN